MPTTFAVISDIHGNLEALESAFADIDHRGIKEVYCLGDVIGYGASPRECLDLAAERCEIILCGNHDQAVFYEPCAFNVCAERAAYWTRFVFEEESNKTARNRRWEVLGGLPNRYEVHGLLFVHASPRRPVNEYLFAITFVYVWAGPHHLLYTALPEWVQSLGMVMSIILIAPSWGGMINGMMTLSGAWGKLRTDPILRFFIVSLSFYPSMLH